MKRKRITIKDIAHDLSLSVSTVSRALNDNDNISDDTKRLVLDTADRLGYKRNPLGSFFRQGITKTIGVLVPEMVTPFAAQVVDGIQDVLNQHGYKAIIAQSNESPIKEKENIHLMESFMVDGVIVSPCHHSDNNVEFSRLQSSGLPLVFYDRIPYKIDVTHVVVNDYASSFFMVEHLIRSGHRKIAYIQGPAYIYNSVERKQGYIDAIRKYRIDINPDYVIETGMTFDDGKCAAQKLLDNKIEFDAIFAFTETLALGAMNYLKGKDINIPKDVSVCCFSGTVLSSIVFPQLTSVEQPLLEMGQTAANLILFKIANPKVKNQKVILDANIVLRASTNERNDQIR